VHSPKTVSSAPVSASRSLRSIWSSRDGSVKRFFVPQMTSLLSHQSLLRSTLAMTRSLSIFLARHGSLPPSLPIHILRTIEVSYRLSISFQSYVPELLHTVVTSLVYLLGPRPPPSPHPFNRSTYALSLLISVSLYAIPPHRATSIDASPRLRIRFTSNDLPTKRQAVFRR